MMLALSLKDFTINNIFSSLNLVQIVLFFVAVVLVFLVGLMVGGIIFYPLAIKQYRKSLSSRKPKITQKPAVSVEAQVEAITETAPKKVVYADFSDESAFSLDNLELDDDELEDISSPDLEHTAPTIPNPEKQEQDDEVDVKPLSYQPVEQKESANPMSVLDDPEFAELVRKRKEEVPVLTRRIILKRLNSLSPFSEQVAVNMELRQQGVRNYDLIKVGDYPFLVLFSVKGVTKLFLRLPQNVFDSIKEAEGNLIRPAAEFGDDWYGFILSDDGKLSLPLKALHISYQYAAFKEYDKVDGELKPVGENRTAAVEKAAAAYNPAHDPEYKAVIKDLSGKYKLDSFTTYEICKFARSIKSDRSTPSAIEYLGNRPAFLKTDDNVYGIVIEDFGVIKLLFRNDEAFVEELKKKHPNYISTSPFPESDDGQWYRLLIDSTYTNDDIKAILDSCYRYVEEYQSQFIPVETEQE